MADLVATDVSLSISSADRHLWGREKAVGGVASFGAAAKTYPTGGIPLPAMGQFGFTKVIDEITFEDPTSGVMWRYDKTNHKVKAFVKAPVIVNEEVVTMTDGTTYDTGTTKYPMAWPLWASNGNQALGLLPAGLNPISTTVAINMHSATPGIPATLTSLHATDNYATITITYITQAWKEVFDNLVEAEIMTAGTATTNGITFTEATPDVINFVGQILCGLMVGLSTAGTVTVPKPVNKGETAVTGEYALEWEDTTTKLLVPTGANWNAATTLKYFNYIKKPASGFLYDNFVEEDAITASSQIATLTGGKILQPLLWSSPGFMVSVTDNGTTSATWPIGCSTMTIGATEQWEPTNYNPRTKSVGAATFTSGTGVLVTLAVKPSYIAGVEEQIPVVVPLEMPSGTLFPRSNSLRFTAYGK